MNETVGSAVRAVVVAWGGVGEAVYLDAAPDAAPWPFVTFAESIGKVPDLLGDGRVIARREVAQVSLWQEADLEDSDMVASLEAALDDADLNAAAALPFVVQRCRLADSQRVADVPRRHVAQHLTLHVVHE